jgi:predicted AAA+ superfamily ATPase
MHHDTAKGYVALLEQMFLVKRLPAWRPGIGAREAATPKLYVCDSGLLAHLLGADAQRIADDDQVTGKLCETFVVGELLRHASWSEQQPRLYHYQREREDVDVVLENNRGDVVGIEVKAAATLRASDWKWLKKLADVRGESFKLGIVVYAGEQTIPLGSRLWAVPYSGLWA